MRLLFRICTFAIVSFSTVSCEQKTAGVHKDAIVQIGDKILTREELRENIPSFLNPEDSILATEHYIKVWISDNLLYNVAQKNIIDQDNIELLVENYRKSLIIYQYQEQLVSEKLSKEISDETLLDYHKNNKDKFKLDRSLIKGLFLRVPVDAPQIEQIRIWYKSVSPASLVNIEKYSLQYSANYDYFFDNWIDLGELMNKWPIGNINEPNYIKSNRFIEQKDDKYYYFLHITDFLLPGDDAPFEYAKSTIKEILVNQKKIEFLRETEADLYKKALGSGQIIFYHE
jgi:hypothetical protein